VSSAAIRTLIVFNIFLDINQKLFQPDSKPQEIEIHVSIYPVAEKQDYKQPGMRIRTVEN
jgi:hypothetical protein